jgi:hypothetical protein
MKTEFFGGKIKGSIGFLGVKKRRGVWEDFIFPIIKR